MKEYKRITYPVEEVLTAANEEMNQFIISGEQIDTTGKETTIVDFRSPLLTPEEEYSMRLERIKESKRLHIWREAVERERLGASTKPKQHNYSS